MYLMAQRMAIGKEKGEERSVCGQFLPEESKPAKRQKIGPTVNRTRVGRDQLRV
jgi:hypothetical protein